MSPDVILCPECGWTGSESDADIEGDERQCPACQHTLKVV